MTPQIVDRYQGTIRQARTATIRELDDGKASKHGTTASLRGERVQSISLGSEGPCKKVESRI